MCSRAVYWSGVRRVVYALAATELNVLAGADPDEPLLDLPCRRVFAAGGNTVKVSGQYLYEASGTTVAAAPRRPVSVSVLSVARPSSTRTVATGMPSWRRRCAAN